MHALARTLAVGGLLALLGVVVAWAGWLAPAGAQPPALRTAVAALPLLLPLPGLLRGRRRAHLWGALVTLPYFTHGVVEAWAGARPWLAGLEIAAAVAAFSGCLLALRARRPPRSGGAGASARGRRRGRS